MFLVIYVRKLCQYFNTIVRELLLAFYATVSSLCVDDCVLEFIVIIAKCGQGHENIPRQFKITSSEPSLQVVYVLCDLSPIHTLHSSVNIRALNECTFWTVLMRCIDPNNSDLTVDNAVRLYLPCSAVRWVFRYFPPIRRRVDFFAWRERFTFSSGHPHGHP